MTTSAVNGSVDVRSAILASVTAQSESGPSVRLWGKAMPSQSDLEWEQRRRDAILYGLVGLFGGLGLVGVIAWQLSTVPFIASPAGMVFAGGIVAITRAWISVSDARGISKLLTASEEQRRAGILHVFENGGIRRFRYENDRVVQDALPPAMIGTSEIDGADLLIRSPDGGERMRVVGVDAAEAEAFQEALRRDL